MTDLAIIADDLTGALDAAAPFATRGLKTIVALSPDALPEAFAAGAAVVGVSTDSREVDADTARSRMGAAAEGLGGSIRVFKKIDSRLKGNVAAELDMLDFERALVVPAIPEFGRWVKDGRLGGFGVDTPIDVREKLGRHSGSAIVPDVSDRADIVAALDVAPDALAVGARGLAEVLAERMGPGRVQADPGFAAKRVIFVIGSRDPITLGQIGRLRDECPELAYVAAPGGVVADGFAMGSDVAVLHATPGPGSDDPRDVARRLADGLASAGPLDDTLVVLSGGATAQVVLGHMGIGLVEVLGEALAGLPIAQTLRFKLITKSGGFGEPDALAGIVSRCNKARGGS